MAWAEFIMAFLVFFSSHSVPVRPTTRAVLVSKLDQRGFTLCYSALSLAALAWVIGAAGRAPYVVLWPWTAWQNHLGLVVMGVVCGGLALSIARPNPFSFGGRNNAGFDPARPGIVRVSRHPLLLALGLWAFAHMFQNGDLAHVMLFGIFGSFAVLGHKIIDHRKQRQMGAEWAGLYRALHASSLLEAMRPSCRTTLRLVFAVLLYGLLIWAHPILFGVSPIS